MTTITAREAWKDQGSCASIGPLDHIWYPEKGAQHPSTVLTVCSGCPVQYQCLTAALATPSTHDFGYWAGNSEKDRVKLRNYATPRPRVLLVSDTATPEQAEAVRAHHADGRSIAWISYAVHLTGPAVRRALRGTKTRRAAA